jgi:hypothetical protein
MSNETPNRAWAKLTKDLPDFCAKAHKLFVANGWTWARDSAPAVPTVEAIESVAYDLSHRALTEAEKDGSHSCCSTGRLQCRFARYNRGWIATLELVPVYTIM